jgi:hypothetical protein
MRSRPDVDIKVPKSVLPGEALHVHLMVTGLSVTPIDFIAVHFHVSEGTRSAVEQGVFDQREVLHETVNVAEAGEIGAEVYRYQASFEVPADLPPSYLGTLFERRAWVEIHVSIPWWPDVRERYDVAILAAPIARPRAEPFTGSSLRGEGAFVEVSLRAQSFAPGEAIEGALAFGNLGGGAQDIELSLLGVEQLVAGETTSSIRATTAFLEANPESEGREIPFGLVIPAATTPSFSLEAGTLSWLFEVRLTHGGLPSVTYRVPVTVAAFEGGAVRSRAVRSRAATAPIGVDRWRAVWASAAADAGLTLDPRKLRLTGELSGCDVGVRVGKSDATRSSLVARLRYRSLGLGLSIENGGLLHAGFYFPADETDRRFKITGRDPAQVRAGLASSLHVALLSFDEVILDDEHADVRSNVPGYDQPWLGEFLGHLTTLARSIEETSRSIPPPAGMGAFLPAWRRFAADLDADLTPGNMEISGGEFEGAIVEIRTELAGKAPIATTLALVIDPPLEAALDLDLARAEAVQQLPAPARERLRAIEALSRRLLEAAAVNATSSPPPVPAPAPVPALLEAQISLRLPVVLADPASLRDLLSALLSLTAALRGDRRVGPYR